MAESFNSAEWCVLIQGLSTTDRSYWILFGSDIRPAEKESTIYSLSWTELCKLIHWIINVQTPVCSLKRGNCFFQTFYSISTWYDTASTFPQNLREAYAVM